MLRNAKKQGKIYRSCWLSGPWKNVKYGHKFMVPDQSLFGGPSTTWILLIVNKPFGCYSPGFFNFGTIEILGWIILCHGCCSVHWRMFTSVIGLHTLDASSTLLSPVVATTSVCSPWQIPDGASHPSLETLVYSTLLVYVKGKLGPAEGGVPPESPWPMETTLEIAFRSLES